MKSIKFIFMLLLVGLPVKNVLAGCLGLSTKTERVVLPQLYIDPNLPVGSVLGAKNLEMAGVIAATCSGSTTYRSQMLGNWSTPSSTVPGVYETNIPGVGIKITDHVNDGRYVPLNIALPPSQTTPLMGRDIKLTFYRTGEIEPGDFSTGSVVAFTLPNSTGVPSRYLTINIMGGGVKIKSCYAKTPNITVPLGSHANNEFDGIGSMTKLLGFNVDLVCQGDGLPILLSFSANGDSAPTSNGVISLDNSEGSSSGVAVKIVNSDGTPLQFDMNKEYRTSDKSISIPLRAGYIQVGQKITPGSANASMTFTITQN